ncbi:MAG: hypothetical protein AABY88_05755 [Pseudomonadota bacterium]
MCRPISKIDNFMVMAGANGIVAPAIAFISSNRLSALQYDRVAQ